MMRFRQSPLRCRKTRHWRIWRPHPRTDPPAPVQRTLRSGKWTEQAREGGQGSWQAIYDPGRSKKEGGDIAAFRVSCSLFWRFLSVKARSGTLTAALVGLGVVVAALLANPVADQVLGALKLLRPSIAGNQARGLPHHVELAVGFDFANEHRLGDVMVRKHLGGAAGQVLGFGAGQRVDHLVG